MKYDYKFLKNDEQEQLLSLVDRQESKNSLVHKELKKRIKFLEKKEEAKKYPTPRSLSQRVYYWERKNQYIPQPNQYHDSSVTIEPSQLYFLKQGDWNGEMDKIIKETVDLSARSETPQSHFDQRPIKMPKLKFVKEKRIQQLGEVETDKSNTSSQKSALTIGRYQRPLKADQFYHIVNRLKQDIKPERRIKQQCFNEAFRILEEVVPASIVLKQQGAIQQFSSTESEIKIEQQKKQKTQLSKGEKVKHCIMSYIRRLKRCKLTHAQVVRDNIFSSTPYSKENSQKFFQAIKENKEVIVSRLLQKTPYLVYDFDNAHMTGLHWAAKRGFANLVKILIQYNADVDAKDIVDRTPLYIATDYAHGKESAKYIEIIQILLYNQAYPWSQGHLKYSNVIRDDKKVKELFAVSRKIHLILLLTPPQLKDFIWNKEVPAMTAIKNVSTNEEKQNINQFELLKGNPHMDPRLKQFYTHKLIYMKRKVGNQAYQEIDKQIQSEQSIFEYVKKHPFQTH